MNYKERTEQMKMELEIRRSIYCEIVSDMFENKSYDDMTTHTKLELITILKSFNKLINKYQS